MVSALPARKSGGKLFGYRRNLAARYRTGHALAEARGVASGNDPDNGRSLIVRQRHSHVKNRLATSHPEQPAIKNDAKVATDRISGLFCICNSPKLHSLHGEALNDA